MLPVMKFVIDNKSFGLKVEPKINNDVNWNLNFFGDSDWAGDPEKKLVSHGL